MSRDTAWLPSEIADQLSELRSWVRWQWLLRGAGRVGAIASLGLIAAFAADYRYDLSAMTRVAVLSSLATVTALAFLVWIIVPLCRRIGWTELAAMADRAHPHWEGALTSAIELFDPNQPDCFKGSLVMREMLLKQMKQRVNELDLEEVVSSRRAWSSVRWGLASCLLLAIPVFFAPSAYRQLWQRFLMPWGNWGTAGLWHIEVENGDRIVARGADVELLATAERSGQTEPPKSLTLEWRDSAGTTDRRAMPFDEARKAFVVLVPHVMRDLDYRIVVERQKSRDYKVQVVEPPVVTKVRLDVEPPAYAGWPAQSLDGAIGAIKVFEKSRLKFTLEFNKPVETAQLVWREHGGANSKLQLTESKQSASLELTADPAVAGPFQFVLKDIHKLANNDTVPRELVVVSDEAPKLTVKGDHSTEARPNDVIPIDVVASDDIGLGTLELHVVVENKLREPIIVDAVRDEKDFEHRFSLDLSQLQVDHGQWLNYRVRVTDERPEPGPHEVWSNPSVLRISSKAAPPGANELVRSHEQLREELKDLRHDIDAKETEIQKFRQEVASDKRPPNSEPDTERVAMFQQQLHELTQRAEQLAAQLARDPLFHELGEKAKQIAQNELANAEAEVQQSRGEPNEQLNREQLDHLQQAEQELDRAAKQLAQLEKPFDQLAELQKDLLELRRFARQAEQLANRADELAKNDDARRGSPDPADDPNQPEASGRDVKQTAADAAQHATEQQQLAEQQRQLADALDDLLKRRPELLNAARRDQLDQLAQLAEEAKQLAQQQQELADALRQQQDAAAERNAELAAKQDDLQKRAEANVARSLRDRNAEEPNAADKPTAPEALQQAAEALKRGDLAEAQQQQQQAADELERLAAELQQAKANPSPIAQAARELAKEQARLAEKAAEAAKSEDADTRQQAAEQLQREQAKLNERIENLPMNNLPAGERANPAEPNPAQAARQEAEQRGAEARQALQDGDLNKAAQEQRRAEQALRELARQAAQTPMPNAQANAEQSNNAPMPNGEQPPQNEPSNKANRDPEARQLAQLAEEQRQLAQEVAQALNEQRGEQPPPNVANQPANTQPPNAGEQPKTGEPANAQAPQRQEPANAAQPNSEQPKGNSGQTPQAQPDGQKPEPQVAQQIREVQQAQQELAQQAQQLQKQVEQELGKESAEAKQSQQTARLCES